MPIKFSSITIIIFCLLITSTCLSDTPVKFRPNNSKISHPLLLIAGADEIALTLLINMPDAYHINSDAPSDAVLKEGDVILVNSRITRNDQKLYFQLPASPARRKLILESTLYYCKDTGAKVCLIKSFTFDLPIEVSTKGTKEFSIKMDIPPEVIE